LVDDVPYYAGGVWDLKLGSRMSHTALRD
jgi:hypothetical protein